MVYTGQTHGCTAGSIASPCHSELSTETYVGVSVGSHSSLELAPDSSEPNWPEGDTSTQTCATGDQYEDRLSVVRMFRQQMLVEHKLQLELISQQQYTGAEPTDPGARMIVVSWMVEVAEEFRLQQETLHMAVLLLDRFLGSVAEEVPRCVLQLLAVGCILLASKDLEVAAPSVEQLCAVTANHFQPTDLLRMERIILNVLDFGLSGPSCYTFLHLLAQVCSGVVTPAVLSLAMYLCELSMLDAYTLGFSYSTKAAAALLLAQISLGAPMHTPAMEAAVSACMGAGGPQDLPACMTVLLRLQHIAYQHTASAVASATAAAAAAGAAAAPAGMDLFSTAQMSAGPTDSIGAHAGAPVAGFSLGATAIGATGRSPAPAQSDDLLSPLRIKFGGDCWCNVSTAIPMVLA